MEETSNQSHTCTRTYMYLKCMLHFNQLSSEGARGAGRLPSRQGILALSDLLLGGRGGRRREGGSGEGIDLPLQEVQFLFLLFNDFLQLSGFLGKEERKKGLTRKRLYTIPGQDSSTCGLLLTVTHTVLLLTLP